MSRIVEVYTEAVYANLRPLRANWEPGHPVRLGDYGPLDGQAFLPQGNVADLGIDIGRVIADDVGDQKIFTSSDNVSVSFTARGASAANPAVTVKAGVELSFDSANTAFFNAAHCSYEVIADKRALADHVMALHASGKGAWKREWAVVTDLVRSKATTIAVASAANARLSIEASGDVAQIDLADASIGLAIRAARNVGYQVIAASGLTPLLGLSQIQSSFLWWGNHFKPLAAGLAGNPRRIAALQSSSAVTTEPDGEIAFRQLL